MTNLKSGFALLFSVTLLVISAWEDALCKAPIKGNRITFDHNTTTFDKVSLFKPASHCTALEQNVSYFGVLAALFSIVVISIARFFPEHNVRGPAQGQDLGLDHLTP